MPTHLLTETPDIDPPITYIHRHFWTLDNCGDHFFYNEVDFEVGGTCRHVLHASNHARKGSLATFNPDAADMILLPPYPSNSLSTNEKPPTSAMLVYQLLRPTYVPLPTLRMEPNPSNVYLSLAFQLTNNHDWQKHLQKD